MKHWTEKRVWQAGALIALSMVAFPAVAQQPSQMRPPGLIQPAAGGVRVVEDGLVANWYAGSRQRSSKLSAVLLLGGSEGGIGSGAARQAAAMVAHGIAVMQLAYFGAPGLPAKLDLVPLEYFDKALAWIKWQPGIGPDRVVVVGASKGAEAALLIATRHPELYAVVGGAPSAAVWPGIDFCGKIPGLPGR